MVLLAVKMRAGRRPTGGGMLLERFEVAVGIWRPNACRPLEHRLHREGLTWKVTGQRSSRRRN